MSKQLDIDNGTGHNCWDWETGKSSVLENNTGTMRGGQSRAGSGADWALCWNGRSQVQARCPAVMRYRGGLVE